jgi:hypothetical protein
MAYTIRISLIVVFLFVLFNIEAQNTTYGLKGAVTTGTPYSEPVDGASGKLGTGPALGVFWKHSFGKHFGINLELFYAFKKASFSSPVSGDTTYPVVIAGTTYNIPTSYTGKVNGQFRNNYIDLPALLAYKIGKKFNLLAGPMISYLFKGSNFGTADMIIGKDPNYPYTTVENEPFDESRHLNKWDYGFVCGTNYEASQRLNLNLNCSYGLRSIYKKGYTSASGTVRNIYLQFSLGYKIGQGKIKAKNI